MTYQIMSDCETQILMFHFRLFFFPWKLQQSVVRLFIYFVTLICLHFDYFTAFFHWTSLTRRRTSLFGSGISSSWQCSSASSSTACSSSLCHQWERECSTPEIEWCHARSQFQYRTKLTLETGGLFTCSAATLIQSYTRTCWLSLLNQFRNRRRKTKTELNQFLDAYDKCSNFTIIKFFWYFCNNAESKG